MYHTVMDCYSYCRFQVITIVAHMQFDIFNDKLLINQP